MPDSMLWLATIVGTLAGLTALIKFLLGFIEGITRWVERSGLRERVKAARPAIQRLFQLIFTSALVVQILALGVSGASLGVSVWIALGPLKDDEAAVEIISPADDSQVKSPVTVQGTCSNIASDRYIWVVVQPHLAGQFHPQLGPAPGGMDGEWSGTAYLRGSSTETPDEELRFKLIAVVANQEASQTFTEYLNRARDADSYPGLDLLPDGAEPKDDVTVTLRRTPTPTPPTPGPTPPTPGPTPPTPTCTALDQITLEGEAGTGDGQVMLRSAASGQKTVWLHDGESRTLSFQLAAGGRYSLTVQYSNDNYGPLETVTVKVDGEVVGEFAAQDTGGFGNGWNVFESGGPISSVDLRPGAHEVTVSVAGGDGYGVEIDLVTLDCVG